MHLRDCWCIFSIFYYWEIFNFQIEKLSHVLNWAYLHPPLERDVFSSELMDISKQEADYSSRLSIANDLFGTSYSSLRQS